MIVVMVVIMVMMFVVIVVMSMMVMMMRMRMCVRLPVVSGLGWRSLRVTIVQHQCNNMVTTV
jgi:hypothetical protein